MLFDAKRDPGFRVIALGTGKGLLSPAQQDERIDSLVSDVPPLNQPPLKGDFDFGLGLTKEHEWIGHGCEMPGYNTSLYYNPELDAVVAWKSTMSHQLDIIPVVAAPLGLWEHSASQARADHPSEGLDLSTGHLVSGLEGVRGKEEDVFDPSFLLSPHQPFGAVLRLPKEAEGVTDSVRKRIRDALRV
jgi:hypothetical protein